MSCHGKRGMVGSALTLELRHYGILLCWGGRSLSDVCAEGHSRLGSNGSKTSEEDGLPERDSREGCVLRMFLYALLLRLSHSPLIPNRRGQLDNTPPVSSYQALTVTQFLRGCSTVGYPLLPVPAYSETPFGFNSYAASSPMTFRDK